MLSQRFRCRLFQLSKVDENAMVWSEKICCIAVSYEVSAHIRRHSKQTDTGMEYLRTYAEKNATLLRFCVSTHKTTCGIYAYMRYISKRYGHGIFADVRRKNRSTFTILRIYAQNNMWNICVHALYVQTIRAWNICGRARK